jgi:hypothetical protein
VEVLLDIDRVVAADAANAIARSVARSAHFDKRRSNRKASTALDGFGPRRADQRKLNQPAKNRTLLKIPLDRDC